MANVINRKTLEYLESVHTPAFPTVDFIVNPELPPGDKKYWKVVGDEVLEMTADEKKVVDGKEKAETEKATAKAERERLIAERSYKIAEEELIAEGVIKKEVSSI